MLRRTYLVDGEIAAMSGLCGDMLGDIGCPYLLTAQAAGRLPLAFLRHYRSAVAEMLQHKLRLEGYVIASYVEACRMLTLVGFTLEKPAPFGPKQALFHRFWMVR